ncbi:MAG: Peroxide-responsive repressor PerR [Deltaproteobacteria bacterium ADurb.Bin510]|jgi:Fur family ferric uptake transcriptional regulator|nr:MAG: Peroxide-responsive repressor PerR [Deltaproteobacteria bacterium ADurb.Bin510]
MKTRAKLTSANLRMTRQRRIILEELCKLKTHPTAYELHGLVCERLAGVSLATVYRNLEILSDQGVIQRLDTGPGQRRFDGNPAAHSHVRCQNCGRVADAHEIPEGLSLRGQILDDCGFLVLGCTVEYTGLCPACQQITGTNAGN